jgi:hypothetical protein
MGSLSTPPSDAEIDALLAASGISIPDDMRETIRKAARDLKLKARRLADRESE